MSYGGHVLDMINRMKQNRKLQQARRERHNRALNGSDPAYDESIYKKVPKKTPEEIAAIKQKYKRLGEKEHRKQRIISIVLIAVLFAIVIFIFISILNY